MQLFVIRVEGISSEEFQLNRSIILRNLAGKVPMKRAWLEMDDFTFVDIQTILRKSNSNCTVSDVNGKIYTNIWQYFLSFIACIMVNIYLFFKFYMLLLLLFFFFFFFLQIYMHTYMCFLRSCLLVSSPHQYN
jgi:hypothetical protein